MSRRTRAQILESRRAARETFGDALWGDVSAVLAAEDPLGLVALGAPRDEYDLEVEALLPRLSGCASAEDVHAAMFEVFQEKFGRAGPRQWYAAAAERVWALWERRSLR